MNAYFEPGKLEPGRLHQVELPVAGLADGSVVRLPLLVAVGRQPGPRIVITAGIHGDEYEGPRALTELLHTLDTMEELKLQFPQSTPARKRELQKLRKRLAK